MRIRLSAEVVDSTCEWVERVANSRNGATGSMVSEEIDFEHPTELTFTEQRRRRHGR